MEARLPSSFFAGHVLLPEDGYDIIRANPRRVLPCRGSRRHALHRPRVSERRGGPVGCTAYYALLCPRWAARADTSAFDLEAAPQCMKAGDGHTVTSSMVFEFLFCE